MSTVRIQVRRGTAAQWTATDPVLEAGEIGFESDTNKFKFGNGDDAWSLLTYAAPGYTDFQNTLDDYLAVGLRGTANGVASLNSSGKVPSSELDITELSQDAVNTALTAGTGITKTYDDAGNTITVAVDTTAIQARVTGVSDTEIGYLDGVTSAIQTQLNAKAPLASPAFTGTVTLPDNTISQRHLNDDSVGTNEISGLAVTNEKLAGSIGWDKLSISSTVSSTELGYVDGVTSAIQTQINAKSPVYSPTFTGTPEAPTATVGTNTTQIATTAFVKSEVDALIAGAPGALNTLDELAAALGDDANYASTITTALSGKLSLSGGTMTGDLSLSGSPTSNSHAATKLYVDGIASTGTGVVSAHTGSTTNVHGIADTSVLATATTVSTAKNEAIIAAASAADTKVLDHNNDTTNVHGIADTSVLVTSTQLGLKQDIVENVSSTEISYLDGVTSSIQTQLNAKLASATAATTYAPIASPAFTGTVSGVTKAMVGLGDVDNTADSAKPVSTATQTALDLKAPLSSPTFTGTVTLPSGTITSTMIADGTIVNDDISSSASIALSKLATDPLARANHTGSQAASTISDFNEAAQDAIGNAVTNGLTYTDSTGALGLNYVTIGNTLLDGVSGQSYGLIGTSTYLDIKDTNGYNKEIELDIAAVKSKLETDGFAKLAGPTFTGTVSGITKSMVGLGNVDNTADADKPVSSATQTALDAKLSKSGGTMTGAITLSGAPTSDLHAATKAYVDGISAGINFHQAVVAATSGNLAGTYNNGTSGYGATLTKASNGSIGTIDGAAVAAGDRILLRAQTNTAENGIYIITAVGSAGAPWVITRAADADNNPSGELATGDFTFVTSGSTYANTGFILSTSGAITIGTTGVTYTQFNAAQAIIAGTGLSKTGGTISIDTATTVDLSTSQTLTNKTINGSNNTISNINLASQVTGTLPVANGGTGITSLGSGIATFWGTPTSANLASAVTDETGTGSLVFSNSPTLVTPALGTPSSGTLTNATGLPISTGVSGLASGISTFLATPTSANLKTAVTDETGSGGALVFATGPTLTDVNLNGTTTYASGGKIQFSDATQQSTAGVPSVTTIQQKTASYTLSALTERDNLIEVASSSATTVTIPLNATVAYPIGTSIDILQTSTGQVTIAGTAGVTVNATPGLKLRTQWSSATLLKRATDTWVVMGDLSA